MNITQNLKTLRKNQKLTQLDMSKKINVSQRTYANYEIGATEPNIDILIKIANYFNISIDFLIGNNAHLIDLNATPRYQTELINMIIQLNELECAKVGAYTHGLLQAKKEQNNIYI